ncbi:hypothetical protein CSKR_107356 [Clonorchis sinensis]|uniref:Uncharacterized protein n=2 Tax=Clonorchis sinensis TaxID=79923 RepID=A0A8T1N0E9_CLOSI|nr:hypothetical protein CSKR_107355 [Clonorchis sinensis]KAG5455098.1 hypothetical protein CSKR_107356 [Clonorchis sinensis]GAA52159.1 hypothetical protein CLF_107424 [Clonorchis sinensis]
MSQSDPAADNTANADHEELVCTKLRSLAPECDSLKAAYDACFQEFFEKFLHGYSVDPCGQKLKAYQKCLRGALSNLGLDMTKIDSTHMNSDAALAAILDKR